MRLPIAAAFAALIFSGTGTHAGAFPDPSPAMSSAGNASDPLEKTYQQTGSTGCSAGICTITFPATTHDKTLISHVSCFFQIPSSATVFSVELGSKTGSEGNFLGVEKYDDFSGFLGYVVNAPTYLFFAMGEKPIVTVVATGSSVSSFSCTLSGNYH